MQPLSCKNAGRKGGIMRGAGDSPAFPHNGTHVLLAERIHELRQDFIGHNRLSKIITVISKTT